jgi:hypothetical protein
MANLLQENIVTAPRRVVCRGVGDLCDNADMQVVRQKRGGCKWKDRDRPRLCAIAHKADNDSQIRISNSQFKRHCEPTGRR